MPVSFTKYMSKITRQAPTHMHEIYAQYAKGNVTDTLHFNVYASACLFEHGFSFYCAHSLNDTSFSFSKQKKKKKECSTAYHNNNNASVCVCVCVSSLCVSMVQSLQSDPEFKHQSLENTRVTG